MILLTGASGMIGRNLAETLFSPPMLTPTHSELDLTDPVSTASYLETYHPEVILNCASNDSSICLYDNLRMFLNLAESKIPMITFCTGRETEDRAKKNGEYVLSKHLVKELSLHKYEHISVIKIWGCFGNYEQKTRFFTDNMLRVKRGEPIVVKENKLFSYVYVRDLARIIHELLDGRIERKIINVVGYTKSLYSYAKLLKQITHSPHEINGSEELVGNPYVGENDYDWEYIPLKTALLEMWSAFNPDTLL